MNDINALKICGTSADQTSFGNSIFVIPGSNLDVRNYELIFKAFFNDQILQKNDVQAPG